MPFKNGYDLNEPTCPSKRADPDKSIKNSTICTNLNRFYSPNLKQISHSVTSGKFASADRLIASRVHLAFFRLLSSSAVLLCEYMHILQAELRL